MTVPHSLDVSEKPLVSVCIPTHNRARLLGLAIESVLTQTYEHWELIIVDNASEDDTPAVAQRFAARDPRIHYCRYDELVPAADNWNRSLGRASGALIAILNDDDQYEPVFLARSVTAFTCHPEVGFSYSAASVIDGEGRLLVVKSPFNKDHIWPATREFMSHVISNYVVAPTVLVRAAVYREVGGYRPQYSFLMDWDLLLRIELAGWSVAYIAQPLARYRLHSGQLTLRLQDNGQVVAQSYAFSHEILRACRDRGIVLPPRTRRRILANSAIVECFAISGSVIHVPPQWRHGYTHTVSAIRHVHGRGGMIVFLQGLWRQFTRQLRVSITVRLQRLYGKPARAVLNGS